MTWYQIVLLALGAATIAPAAAFLLQFRAPRGLWPVAWMLRGTPLLGLIVGVRLVVLVLHSVLTGQPPPPVSPLRTSVSLSLLVGSAAVVWWGYLVYLRYRRHVPAELFGVFRVRRRQPAPARLDDQEGPRP